MISASVNGSVSLYYDGGQKLYTASTGIQVTGNANISGQVQVGGANSLFSENNLRFSSAGAAYIDHNTTSQDINFRVSNSSVLDTTAMIIKSDGDVEFKDDVEIDGNLTVDGSIIHGGGGIFSGDQSVTSAGGATLAFTLTRATTGTLIFDVWFTSETSKETSVAKKYVVARGTGLGFTPVYNKIIDTGPSLYPNNNNTTDFTVSFIDDPAAATAGTSILCKITVTGTNSSGSALTQNIGYTVQVGHDSTNALTFTPAS